MSPSSRSAPSSPIRLSASDPSTNPTPSYNPTRWSSETSPRQSPKTPPHQSSETPSHQSSKPSAHQPLDSNPNTKGKGRSERARQCKYYECAKGLLEKQIANQSNANIVLTKVDKDHIRRMHSMTPVKIVLEESGCTVIQRRNPALDMRFQCPCGSKMLSRDAARDHHPCKKLAGVTSSNDYFLIVSSDKEPVDVQGETQSDGEEAEEVEEREEHEEVEEEEEEGDEKLNTPGFSYGSVVPWQSLPPLQPHNTAF
ncbi:hypothetical protein BGW39_003356, partial [Mortierella sp. 14UC]